MPAGNPEAYTLPGLRRKVIPPTPTEGEKDLQGRVAKGGSRLSGVPSVPSGFTPGGDTRDLRSRVADSARDLTTAPNRQQLAADTFDLIRDRSDPAFEQALRKVGQKAGAMGRLGAGMTTTGLGDVTAARERFLSNASRQLSLEAAGKELQDRLGTISALSGVQSGLFGQDMSRAGMDQSLRNESRDHLTRAFGMDTAALNQIAGLERGRRDELRGERGRADRMAEIANQRRIQQAQMEAQLQSQLFQQLMGRAGTAGQFGFGGVTPVHAAPGLSDEAGRQGTNARNQGLRALMNFFMNRARQGDVEPVATDMPPTAGADPRIQTYPSYPGTRTG